MRERKPSFAARILQGKGVKDESLDLFSWLRKPPNPLPPSNDNVKGQSGQISNLYTLYWGFVAIYFMKFNNGQLSQESCTCMLNSVRYGTNHDQKQLAQKSDRILNKCLQINWVLGGVQSKTMKRIMNGKFETDDLLSPEVGKNEFNW